MASNGEDSSFLIKDSDDDEDFVMDSANNTAYGRNFHKDKDIKKTIIESNSEFSDSENECERATTPSIKRAIRNSILNMSRPIPVSEDEQDDEDDDIVPAPGLSIRISDSSGSDDLCKNSKHKRAVVNRISSGDEMSSDNESKSRIKDRSSFQTKMNISVVSSSDSDDELLFQRKKPVRKFNPVLDISSDEDEIPLNSFHSKKSTPRNLRLLDEHNMSVDSIKAVAKSTPKGHRSTRYNAVNDDFSDIDVSIQSYDGSVLHSPRQPVKSNLDSSNFKVTDKPMESQKSFKQSVSEFSNVKMEKENCPPNQLSKSRFIDERSSSDDMEIQEVSDFKTTLPRVIDIGSDSSDNLGRFSDNEPHDAIINLAKEELGNEKAFDHLTAQKRVLLVCNINKTENELKKSKLFLQRGAVEELPDKGERLRQNVTALESKLKKLKDKLKNIQLIKMDKSSEEKKKPPSLSKKANDPFSDTDGYHDSNSSDNYDDDKENAESGNFSFDPMSNFDRQNLGERAQATLAREGTLTVDTLKNFHGSLATRPAENVLAKDPRGLKVPLMPHQQHALAWLIWREKQKPPGGVLADDMGLGKTLTMISLVMASNAAENNSEENSDDEGWVGKARALKYSGGTLVVCPASLINQWDQEIKKRTKAGVLNTEVHHGPNRTTSAVRLAKNDIVITTYAILSRTYKCNGVLFKIKWKRVILDEAHVIRNHKSQSCESVCGLTADKRWALTGTPIHNKEMDLFAILKFIKVQPFDDIRVWKRWVDNKNFSGHDRLATVMKTLMLRRTKEELMRNGSLQALPDRSSETKWIELDSDERLVYQKVMIYSKTLFAQFLAQRADKHNTFAAGSGNYIQPANFSKTSNSCFNKAQERLLASHAEIKTHEILVLLLRLRQVCCHPSLIHAMLDQEDLEQSGLEEGMGLDTELLSQMNQMNLDNPEFAEHLNDDGDIGIDEGVTRNILTSDNPVFASERQSSKLRAVLDLLKVILEKDEKIIVVSQWTSVLDIIGNNLSDIPKATFSTLSGKVPVKDRQDIIDDFNYNRNPKILLLSLTAGGVGLNLVGANHLIFMDIHWNPQLESQAQDRIYRFGQKKNVFIYKLLVSDSIEERIKNLQEKKLAMAHSVLSGTGKVANSKLTLDDLKSLFSF